MTASGCDEAQASRVTYQRVSFGVHQSFAPFLRFSFCLKHGGHSASVNRGFLSFCFFVFLFCFVLVLVSFSFVLFCLLLLLLLLLLFVTFWFAESALVNGSPDPSVAVVRGIFTSTEQYLTAMESVLVRWWGGGERMCPKCLNVEELFLLRVVI